MPYPPDYGGVIDVFYKIKALHQAGVRIHLHCFMYGRQKQEALEAYCATVHYYPRSAMWKAMFSAYPFIVRSRNAPDLLRNLAEDNYPILFEGMHCCYYLADPLLRDRLKMVRMHNNEPQYYLDLARREKSTFRKLYYYEEYKRLSRFEPQLQCADKIFSIARDEALYYGMRFPSTEYLAPFHGNSKVTSALGTGTYALYHGNLSVNENIRAVEFLVQDVWKDLHIPLVIAGKNPPESMKTWIRNNDHIRLIENPSSSVLHDLIRDAQVNVLPAFQETGVKLKLINTLFSGRFCIVNTNMIAHTGLDAFCFVEDTTQGFREKISQCMELPFDNLALMERRKIEALYTDEREVQKIISFVQKNFPPQPSR